MFLFDRLWLRIDTELKAEGKYPIKSDIWNDDAIEIWKERLPQMCIDIEGVKCPSKQSSDDEGESDLTFSESEDEDQDAEVFLNMNIDKAEQEKESGEVDNRFCIIES